MKKLLRLLPIIILLFTIFSCTSNDDDSSITNNNSAKIIGTWYTNDINVIVYFTFNKNNTFTRKYKMSANNSTNEYDVINGTYYFESEDLLVMKFEDSETDYRQIITFINDKKFELKKTPNGLPYSNLSGIFNKQ